ncbi:uncharacterized protein JCM15063_002894 [Sporobolomyces koalae]|uniref:uncharacterized protein n=1 Tax=Sporobolomyces koalae TaxID=500713 RepID=UPI0031817423
MISFGTDGDAARRRSFIAALMSESFETELPELFRYFEDYRVPGLDSSCGAGGTHATFDFRHLFKPFGTTIPRVAGIKTFGSVVTEAVFCRAIVFQTFTVTTEPEPKVLMPTTRWIVVPTRLKRWRKPKVAWVPPASHELSKPENRASPMYLKSSG